MLIMARACRGLRRLHLLENPSITKLDEIAQLPGKYGQIKQECEAGGSLYSFRPLFIFCGEFSIAVPCRLNYEG
jgi:hypothetical protein